MADATNTVQDDSAPANSDAQPGATLLTDASLTADDAGKVDNAAADSGAAAPDGKEGDKPDPTQPEGDAEGKKDGEGDKPEGAPEKYELTLPEGMAIDEQALAAFDPLLRKHNLSNEQASELATAFADLRKADIEQQTNAWKEQVQTWDKAVRNDKEIGGEHFTASMKAAQKAITTYGTPELTAALNATGMGNHPEFVRAWARVGKAMSEDKFIPAGQPAAGEKKGLYSHLPQS